MVKTHIRLSLIGPKLEAGTKLREALSYSSGFGHFELIFTEVTVWLPGRVARDSDGLTSRQV